MKTAETINKVIQVLIEHIIDTDNNQERVNTTNIKFDLDTHLQELVNIFGIKVIIKSLIDSLSFDKVFDEFIKHKILTNDDIDFLTEDDKPNKTVVKEKNYKECLNCGITFTGNGKKYCPDCSKKVCARCGKPFQRTKTNSYCKDCWKDIKRKQKEKKSAIAENVKSTQKETEKTIEPFSNLRPGSYLKY